MQIIVVLLLSFQVLWTYSLPTRWVPKYHVCQLYGSENFACIACTYIESSQALSNTPYTPNYIMSTGSGEDGSPSRGEPRSTPRAIQLTVKYPTFNWDQGDPHKQFKWFKHRTEILMEGPYEDYKDPDKVAAILGWLGDKGHQIYASIDWVAMDLDKKKVQGCT